MAGAAVTADQVGVVLDADVDAYIRDLGRADSAFSKLARDAEREAKQLGRAFSTLRDGSDSFASEKAALTAATAARQMAAADLAATRAKEGVTREAIKSAAAILNTARANESAIRAQISSAAAARAEAAAFNQVSTAATGAAAKTNAVAASSNKLGSSTANIAAQFQDIGVQIQAGTSPLTIALQQGTQLSAVFEQLRASGLRAGPALASAFASIVSPISVAILLTIALGSAAIQWLGSLVTSAETANEAIERHRKALEGIVEGYDAAKSAASDYIDAAKKLPREIAIDNVRREFAEIAKEGEKFRTQIASFGKDGTFAKYGSEAILTMQGLSRQFAAGEITAGEFYISLGDVKKELNLLEVAGAAVPGSTASMINAFQEGALKAIAFGDAINQLVASTHLLAGIGQDEALSSFFDENSVDTVINKLKGLTPELRTQKEIIEETYNTALKNPALTDAAREQIAVAKDAALAAHDEVAARKLAEEAARKQASTAKQSANDREQERQAVESLLEKLREEAALVGITGKEKEIAIALRKAGAAATAEERNEIEQLIAFTYEQNKAIKENAKSMQEFLSIGGSGVQTFIDAILDGKSATEAWGSVLNDIGRQLIRLGINGIFGNDGSIANYLGLSGQRAAGGPVRAGGAYLVGENGPEVFRPTQAGAIERNGSAGGQMAFSFSPTLNMPGADRGTVAEAMARLDIMESEFVTRVRNQIDSKGRKW